MSLFNIICKISFIIVLIAVSLKYSNVGPSAVHIIHQIVPAWLYSHSKSKTDNNANVVYKIISNEGDALFSKDELAKFVGTESENIYLAILGRVYDVSTGKQYYSPGSGYGFFAGKDGTRAYMTGEFTPEGLIEDATGLTPLQMIELEDWIKFYDDKYIYKGKLHGLYYDEKGLPTSALYEVEKNILAAKKEKIAAEEEKKRFPPCNHEWGQTKATRVWCSEKSGGITRDWIGVPRKYFPPGAKQELCVCVRTSGPPSDNPTSQTDVGDLENPYLHLYERCDALSNSCQIIE